MNFGLRIPKGRNRAGAANPSVAAPRRLARAIAFAWVAASPLLFLPLPLVMAQAPPPPPQAPAQPQSKSPAQPPAGPAEEPSVEIPAAPGAAPEGAEGIRFELRDIVIDGSTVYPSDELRAIYAGAIGTETTLARLFEIAQQVQQKYRADGYLLAQVLILPQTVSDGVFRFRVIEGFIDRVRIEGEIGPVRKRLQGYLDRITRFRPVREQDVERYLLLANDIPGVRVFGVLQRGSELGASELVVRAERKPFEAFSLINNVGSKYMGPLRGGLLLQENAATRFGERAELFLFASEKDEQQFGQFAYEHLLGSEGLKLRFSAEYGPSEPGFDLEPLDVETKSWALRTSLTYPVMRSRKKNLYVGVGLDAVNQKVDVFGDRLSKDKLRVMHVKASYDFRDRLKGLSTLGLELRQGLGFLGASAESDEELSRQGGDPQFTSVNLHGSRYQALFHQFGLYLAARGQYAFDKLLNDELSRVGGETFGRGYDPSELSGDHGLGLGADLQYTESRPFGPLRSYQLYGFYDTGVVWNKGSDGERRQSLASTGFGMQFQFLDYFFVDLKLAWPLTRKPLTQDDDVRFLFQVTPRY